MRSSKSFGSRKNKLQKLIREATEEAIVTTHVRDKVMSIVRGPLPRAVNALVQVIVTLIDNLSPADKSVVVPAIATLSAAFNTPRGVGALAKSVIEELNILKVPSKSKVIGCVQTMHKMALKFISDSRGKVPEEFAIVVQESADMLVHFGMLRPNPNP